MDWGSTKTSGDFSFLTQDPLEAMTQARKFNEHMRDECVCLFLCVACMHTCKCESKRDNEGQDEERMKERKRERFHVGVKVIPLASQETEISLQVLCLRLL